MRGISQSASQSDADQWLKAWMLYLWLADSFMVQFMWIVVLSCSARMEPHARAFSVFSSKSLSHVVQSVLPLGAMAFFRTARQTSHGIRHLSLKDKLSHSLGKLVSATFSVLSLGPLRSYKAHSFSNRLLRRGTDLLTVYV